MRALRQSQQQNVSATYWVANGIFDDMNKTLFFQLLIITVVITTGGN